MISGNFIMRRNHPASGTRALCDFPIPAGLSLDEMTFHVVKIGLLPDFNRDRKINDEGIIQLIAKGPFRFWVNDDEDDGDVADDDSDIPNSNAPNHNDNQMNGRSDLLDFFPIWVNVEKLIENSRQI